MGLLLSEFTCQFGRLRANPGERALDTWD